MPDDQTVLPQVPPSEALKEIVPPVLMALGAISLLRMSRVLSLAVLGGYLYHTAVDVDASRKKRGRDILSKRAAGARLDEEIEDSFPASDPPSFSGSTAGAP